MSWLSKVKKYGKRVAKKAVKKVAKRINLKKLTQTALSGLIATNPMLASIPVGWKMLKTLEKTSPEKTVTLKEAKAFYAAGFEKGRRLERKRLRGAR